jgi:hypothetical protein
MSARIEDVVPNGDNFIVTVRCPYCSKTHQHGMGAVSTNRSAHCGKGDYFIPVIGVKFPEKGAEKNTPQKN